MRQTPATALDMQKQTGVAEDLELLPNFIPDMAVVGMKLFQLMGECIGVGGRELRFAETPDGIENVQSPASFFGFNLS